MADLKALREVDLSQNYLNAFPVQLSRLKQLNALNLARNRIKQLPTDVRFLQVVELNLNQNQVVKLASVSQIKSPRFEQ